MTKRQHPVALSDAAFAKVVSEKQVGLYRLHNKLGMSVAITNLGAKIVQLIVPDKEGYPVDVVLGHDSIQDYIDSGEPYFGAICGRYANRIAAGRFSIDGTEYQLAINNGPNALHGGLQGFNSVPWMVIDHTDQELHLRYISVDGEEGYPGTLEVDVIYALSEHDNSLTIRYRAATDKPTVLNLTNHAYFNLSGEGDPSVHDHLLTIHASHYLPTDETAIPYGPAEEVAGTPFDFTEAHFIGERIDEPTDQLTWARGYDHTFVADKPLGALAPVLTCSSPSTGIRLSIETTEPGVQLYTGNWLSGNMRGKGENTYPARSAVCFETQHFPDSPNRPDYPSTLLRPGETFESESRYTFDIYK